MAHAEYVLSAVRPDQYPKDELAEIAFIGRSNVGKSSLINGLLNRKNLARVSGQPGKTQTINFYMVDKTWFLVDLPGYGYARVSKEQRQNWQKMIERYLLLRPESKYYWQLVDIRHSPSRQDIEMHEWLKSKGLKTLVVATKLDKINKSQRVKNLNIIKKELNLEKEIVLPFSALTKEGAEKLWQEINNFLH